MIFTLAAVLAGACLLAAIALQIRPDLGAKLRADYELAVFGPLLLIGIVGALLCLLARSQRSFIAYTGVLVTVLLVVSYWVNPAMNWARSGSAFIARVEQQNSRDAELGILAFKEQYLLNLHRPIVHFGHARWREAAQEAADAALWLSQSGNRQLLVTEHARDLCFTQANSKAIGPANRIQWYLVRGEADADCVARGKAEVYYYSPGQKRIADGG